MDSEYLHPEVIVVPSPNACLDSADDAHVRQRWIWLVGRPLPYAFWRARCAIATACRRGLIWQRAGDQCAPHARTAFQTFALESESRKETQCGMAVRDGGQALDACDAVW